MPTPAASPRSSRSSRKPMKQAAAPSTTTCCRKNSPDQINNMLVPEQVMAKAGFRRELERTVDVARNDGAAARKMLDTNSNLQKTEDLFGPRARQILENRIAAETKFQDAAQKIGANSRTAVRSQLVKDTESPSMASPPQANITGFLYKGAGQGLQYLRDLSTEKTRTAIGRMSTMQGATSTISRRCCRII